MVTLLKLELVGQPLDERRFFLASILPRRP
jgi:hypothetical protein